MDRAMCSASDVAEYILQQTGRISAMKLQKLVYYSQAWSLVWDERPLFNDPIEAWKNGPVVCSLYDYHSGMFWVERGTFPGNSENLDRDSRETVDAVLEFYAHQTAQWLSDLTHAEDPWREAREGLQPDEPGHQTISLASMHQYYSGLVEDE